MASRLALGRSTNARARLEALFRVIVRLSCMRLRGRRGGRIVGAFRRQAAGFGQSRVARKFLPATAAVAFAAAPALTRLNIAAALGGGRLLRLFRTMMVLM